MREGEENDRKRLREGGCSHEGEGDKGWKRKGRRVRVAGGRITGGQKKRARKKVTREEERNCKQ